MAGGSENEPTGGDRAPEFAAGTTPRLGGLRAAIPWSVLGALLASFLVYVLLTWLVGENPFARATGTGDTERRKLLVEVVKVPSASPPASARSSH